MIFFFSIWKWVLYGCVLAVRGAVCLGDVYEFACLLCSSFKTMGKVWEDIEAGNAYKLFFSHLPLESWDSELGFRVRG